MRWVSIGVSSLACTWRKCRSRSRTALTSRTGTLTSPKLSDPVHSDLAKARLQRGGQVVGLVLRLGLARVDLLAVALALDDLQDRVAVAVGVLVRLELRLEAADELAGHLELAL